MAKPCRWCGIGPRLERSSFCLECVQELEAEDVAPTLDGLELLAIKYTRKGEPDGE